MRRLSGSLAAVALCGIARVAAAQSGTDIVERCQDIEDADARIACLEAAVLGLAGDASAADEAVNSAAPAEVPSASERAVETSSAPDQAAEAPTVIEPPGQTSVPVVPAGLDEVAEGRPDEPTSPKAIVPGEPDSGPTGNVTGIGAEQVESANRTREEHLESLAEAYGLGVERFETVGYRQLQIYLDNGQIWRQIRGDWQEIRVTTERNPVVDIVESSIGGYRMHLTGIDRIIRVRRVR